MKIDSHQHFWDYSVEEYGWIDDSMPEIKKSFLPEDLTLHLDEHDFDGCVAVQARESEEETNWLLELASANNSVKGVVGWVDFFAENLHERLEHFCGFENLCGFREIVQGKPDDFLLGKDFLHGIKALLDYNLTYDVLIFARQLPAAINFVQNLPENKLVLDHIAKPDIKANEFDNWKAGIVEISQCENLYCKISGIITETHFKQWNKEDFYPYLDVIFESFGTDRLMFGSDWPVCKLSGEYGEVIDVIESYTKELSENEQAQIWGKNATDFYSLN